MTGEDLNDEVEWCKFGSMTWEESGKGFFYASFPRPKKLEVTLDRTRRPFRLVMFFGFVISLVGFGFMLN